MQVTVACVKSEGEWNERRKKRVNDPRGPNGICKKEEGTDGGVFFLLDFFFFFLISSRDGYKASL